MKFRTRLIIFYLATAIVSMLIIGAAIWGSLELYKTKTVENQLSEQSKLIFAYIKQVFLFEEKRTNELNRQNGKLIASNLSTGIGQVQIYNKELELQCNPVELEKESSLEEDEYRRLILEPAIKGDKVFYTKNKVVYYSVPVVQDAKTIGVLVIVYKLDLLNEFLNKVLYILVAGAVVFCCLIVIISIYISKKMVKPINSLVETTERYAKRDFVVFDMDRNDELGQLSRSINSMGSQLQEYIGRQKQFISNVSHEIRTPLTAIKGYSEFLYDEIAGNPDIDSALVHLKSESARLEKLVNDHLNLSRLDSFQESFVFSKTNFSNLVLDTAAKLKNKAAERNITINTNLGSEVFINADPERIVQVVINILDNAIKYSHNYGTVEMELYREKSNAVLTVKDYGIGIPREDLKNVFERFHRASNTKGIAGTGLGLAISNIIVDRHNGKLNIESTVNAGTKVILTIPSIEDV
jgi:signal transduction histidine kinase